jgi:hypothetical protein
MLAILGTKQQRIEARSSRLFLRLDHHLLSSTTTKKEISHLIPNSQHVYVCPVEGVFGGKRLI